MMVEAVPIRHFVFVDLCLSDPFLFQSKIKSSSLGVIVYSWPVMFLKWFFLFFSNPVKEAEILVREASTKEKPAPIEEELKIKP